MASVLHASDRAIGVACIESVGKQARDETGKHPVNEHDEVNFHGATTGTSGARNEMTPLARTHNVMASTLTFVMAGLVPAIHVFSLPNAKTWMPGTSPGMTKSVSMIGAKTTPGSRPSCRARPVPRRGARSARDRASTRRSRDRSRGRTPPRQDRRRARRKFRP